LVSLTDGTGGVAIFCGEGYEIGGSAFDGKEAAWIATHLRRRARITYATFLFGEIE
jgi:hypothetical protein